MNPGSFEDSLIQLNIKRPNDAIVPTLHKILKTTDSSEVIVRRLRRSVTAGFEL